MTVNTYSTQVLKLFILLTRVEVEAYIEVAHEFSIFLVHSQFVLL